LPSVDEKGLEHSPTPFLGFPKLATNLLSDNL
jgi:hypothetical protein